MAEERPGNIFLGEEIKKSFVKYYKQISIFSLAVLLILIGSITLRTSYTGVNNAEYESIYTDCYVTFPDLDSVSCWDYLESHKGEFCMCSQKISLSKPLIGEVILYYELTDFDQTSKNYVNSRDDKQLTGILEDPSENCEPYRYDIIDNKTVPIAPCGAIANAMIIDIFSLKKSGTDVPLLSYGMLSEDDKNGFHNPENLQLALKNFTKPKSWSKNIWELDTVNADNNGFQNERFISWMRTDWKRKHYARLDRSQPGFENGLPNGTYELFVDQYAPLERYNGTRKIILVSTEKYQNTVTNTLGAVLLTVGLLILVAGLLGFYGLEHLKGVLEKATVSKERNEDQATNTPKSPEEVNETPLLNRRPAT